MSVGIGAAYGASLRAFDIPSLVSPSSFSYSQEGESAYSPDSAVEISAFNSRPPLFQNLFPANVSGSAEVLPLGAGIEAFSGGSVEVTAVAAGPNHAFAVDTSGNLWAWGSGTGGVLGLGNATSHNIPQQVTNPDGALWKSVAAGANHTLAIDEDGDLWSWGANGQGQLGRAVNPANPGNVPRQVGSATSWQSVAAGENYSLAIDEDGSLWAWGSNANFRTGLGVSTGNTPSPQMLADVLGGPTLGGPIVWQSVAAGRSHALAIDSVGQLWAWGNGQNGALGLGGTAPQPTPSQVTVPGAAADWESVTAGTLYTLAIDADGALWGWGTGAGGRLGLGTPINQETPPTQVPVPVASAPLTSVFAGDNHTLAIDEDGGLWVWGNGAGGRLGLGDETARFLPVSLDVDGVDSWELVAAGLNHTMAVDSEGRLWNWGRNNHGQLGKGITAANMNDRGLFTENGTPTNNAAVATQGSDNWLPWRAAASLAATTTADWTVAGSATSPEDGEVDVALTTDEVIVRFDRSMDTSVVGTIAIDSGATVDLTSITAANWSDADMVFTAPLTLVTYDTTHTATIYGFVDAQFGNAETNEMYPYTWQFKTEESDFYRAQLSYAEASCSTCHFTDNVVQEHMVRANGCQTCHSTTFGTGNKTNWSQVTAAGDALMRDLNCMSCHGGPGAEIHGGPGGAMLTAHDLSPGVAVDDRGCSASGCHSNANMAAGFAFGDMNFASAHNDFWQAAQDGRVSADAYVVPPMRGDANPFGCGVCHSRESDRQDRLRQPIADVVEADRASGTLSCETCHNSDVGSGPYTSAAVLTHYALRVPPALLIDVPTGASASLFHSGLGTTDFLSALSPQIRAEFASDLQEGERLQPGVLASEDSTQTLQEQLLQQEEAQSWLELRRGLGDLLTP